MSKVKKLPQKKKKYKTSRHRLAVVLFLMSSVGVAVFFSVLLLGKSVSFYLTPSELLLKGQEVKGRKVRLAGIMQQGSLRAVKEGPEDNEGQKGKERGENSISSKLPSLTEGYRFVLEDNKASFPVLCSCLLPELATEGQMALAEGELNLETGVFYAYRVLAKHDENYKPPIRSEYLDEEEQGQSLSSLEVREAK